MKLKSLNLDAFRGATKPFDLVFNTKARITILYGANGTGKTTIVDALDVLANAGNSSLDDKKVGAVGVKPFVSIGRTAKETAISLVTENGAWVGRPSGTKFAVTPSEGIPRVRVMRRRALAGLIDEAGASRYEKFSQFIDTAAIEECEMTLRKAVKAAVDDLNHSSAKLEQAIQALQTEWQAQGNPQGDFETWRCSLHAQAETEKEQQLLDLYQAVADRCRDLRNNHGDLLKEEISMQQALEAVHSAKTAEEKARCQAQDAELAELRKLLNEAKTYLHKHRQGETCPLCQSPVSREDLLAGVEKSLHSLQSLEIAAKALDDAKKSHENQKGRMEALGAKIAANLQLAAKAIPVMNVALSPDFLAFAEEKPKDFAHAYAGLQLILPRLEEIQNLATQARDDLQASIRQRQTMLRFAEDMESQQETSTQKESLVQRLQKCQTIVETQRKQYVKGILADISSDASRIYEAIHPGEGLANVNLSLDEAKRGSLNLKSTVPGLKDETNPAIYYSEAHVDTLGLAVFLAEALRDTPENTILVLDDVVSSVDDEHLERIVNMLYEESKKFAHVILTTHYKPWREKWRMGMLRDKEADLLELVPKIRDGGIGTQSLRRPERERLQELLASSDPDFQSIAAKAGVILEQLLYFLTHKYALSLPVGKHESGWTIGEYFHALSDKRLKSLRAERLDAEANVTASIDVGSKILEVKQICGLRNVLGCHYNKLAELLPDTEAAVMGNAVLELANRLVDETGELPDKTVAGQFHTTSRRTYRLFPFSLRDI